MGEGSCCFSVVFSSSVGSTRLSELDFSETLVGAGEAVDSCSVNLSFSVESSGLPVLDSPKYLGGAGEGVCCSVSLLLGLESVSAVSSRSLRGTVGVSRVLAKLDCSLVSLLSMFWSMESTRSMSRSAAVGCEPMAGKAASVLL